MIATVPEAIPTPLATPHPCTWQTTGFAEDCPLLGRAEVTGAGGRLSVWRHLGVAVSTTAADSEITSSSSPDSRRFRFLISCGLRLPARSRGTSRLTGPASVSTV